MELAAMLYSASLLDAPENAVISSIDKLCERLEQAEKGARSWTGILSRQVFSRRNGPLAKAHRANPEPADPNGDDWRALEGYRRALKHASQRFVDPSFSYSTELILALHFMITEHNPTTRSGTWRSDRVSVHDVDGEMVYEPPAPDQVPALMDELVESLNPSNDEPPLIRAAIAHLNMVRIHPFHDGNGRMGRCLQTLVLMHEHDVPPEIASLEEYIGQHTRGYNEALLSTATCWEPRRDTKPWINFCLTAHYEQAIALVTKVTELELLHEELCAHTTNRGALPDGTLQRLSKIFGARSAVIERWWRMRPDRVIGKLIGEANGYRLRCLPVE